MKIEDGTGSGNMAKINSNNRLETQSVTETGQINSALIGEAFNVGSGFITLTSANESAVLYYKNNEDRDVVVTAVNVTSSAQTGSSANVFLTKVYRGATGISAGTASTGLNNNYGSARELDAVITQGQEAATVTNGTATGAFFIPTGTFFNTELSWVIPKGKSMVLSVTPGASNTSVSMTVTFELHIAPE